MKRSLIRLAFVVSSVVGLSCFANVALAGVRKTGDWPADEKAVTVAIDAPRVDAVKKLAAAAGWNVVLPEKLGGGTERIHVDVHDESASAVLEAILDEGDYVATRHGKLVTVREAKDASAGAPAEAVTSNAANAPGVLAVPAVPEIPAVPALPAVPAVPGGAQPPVPPAIPASAKAAIDESSGEDRSVMGGNARIEKDERVHDVSVMGGNVDIEGTVTGDVSVMGGKAEVRDGAHIMGDAVAVGGALDIDKGARVDGDVGVVGGVLRRHEGAIIKGKVVSTGAKFNEKEDHGTTAEDGSYQSPHGRRASTSWLKDKFHGAGSAVTRTSILFVFGVIVLSLFRKRYEGVKMEIVSRPVKSFAIGIVALVLSIVATVVLCLTVVGIPLAVIGWLFAALCIYGGIVSVLTLGGEVLLRHRTQNTYWHLAAGCALFLLLTAIPVVGPIVTIAVMLLAIGSVWQTRAGGLFAKEK